MRHVKSFESHLYKKIVETKTFIKENEDIMFTVADKGNVTVALNKSTYKAKVNELLSDIQTYKPLKKNPLNKLIDSVKSLVKRWFDKKFINDKEYKAMYTTTGNLARAYALPKIHKKNTPFRPIVSSIGSPIHKFASFIQQILSKGLNNNEYSIKNGAEFANVLKNIRIPDDHCMISLDVTSLFTKIPNELVISSIESEWSNISKFCNIPWSEMKIAINLIMNSTYIQFDEKCYQQIDGSPMGNPASPVFAEYCMRKLEYDCIEKLDFSLIKYHRYVDDIFCILPRNRIQNILNVFNSYHPNLQFTHEIENNSSISFLDVLVINNKGNILTNWYKKPTYSGRVLHFKSSNPISQKKAMIYGLVDKAMKLSDERFHNDNLIAVQNILLKNLYPVNFINRHIEKRTKFILEQCHNRSTNNPDDCSDITESKITITLPFHSALNTKFKNFFRSLDSVTVFRLNNKLDYFVKRGKDPLNIKRKYEVVYQIDCKDCQATYIGQTKRTLETRLKEHRNNYKLHPDKHNVITKHMLDKDHIMNWDKPRVLDTESNFFKRSISEMLHIKYNSKSINAQLDTEKLSPVYLSIINQ